MKDPRPTMISARPPETRSSVENSWKTRIGSSELRTVTALVSRMRCVRAATAASTTAGVETVKSGRWCSPTPKTSRPTSSASSASSTTSRRRCSGLSPSRVSANVKTPISMPRFYRSGTGLPSTHGAGDRERGAGGEKQADPEQPEPDPENGVELRPDAHVRAHPSRGVGVHQDDAPGPVLGVPVDRLLASTRRRGGPETPATRWGRRCAPRTPLELGIATVVEIVDLVSGDVAEVAVDSGRGTDADEDRPLALAANAHRAEEGVERPLRAARVKVGALGDDRVRRGRELAARRHEEAVVVALRAVDDDERASAREKAESQDSGDHAEDDEHDLAGAPASARLDRRRRRRRLLGRERVQQLRPRLVVGWRRVAASLVEPEGRVLVAHEEHVGGDARDPAVEAEREIEHPPRVARREQQGHGSEEDDDADQTRVEADA